MRKIDTIIIHHSISPRDLSLEKSLSSFDRSHAARLHPEKNSLGYHIAYHYVIAGDGSFKQTRGYDEIGYHASNLTVNERSIGICLCGDFDKENPSEGQINALQGIIKKIKDKYPIEKISGHREYAHKTCPGKNISDDFINSLLTLKNMAFQHDYIDIMKKEVPEKDRIFTSYQGEEAQIKALIEIALYRKLKGSL